MLKVSLNHFSSIWKCVAPTRRRGVCRVSWTGSASGSVRRSCGSRSGNGTGSETCRWSNGKACWERGAGRKAGILSLVKGSSWMEEKRRESKGSSRRGGPEECPPMDRGSGFHGPDLGHHGRAESRGADSWIQASSGTSCHFLLSSRGTEDLQTLFLSPGCIALVKGFQSAC